MGWLTRRAGLGIAVLAMVAPTQVPVTAMTSNGPHFRNGGGLTVRGAKQVNKHLFDVSVTSPAIGRPLHVRILLPADYSRTTRRYPVLYLYSGTGGHAPDWVEVGHADQVLAGRPLITVMPDIGFGVPVWFSDWVNKTTSLGPSQWETFYIGQLIPWADANLRTRAERSGRAIAGLSQGGFGAMIAAARHPELFAAAASMSGATDIAYDRTTALTGHTFVTGTESAQPVPPFSIFGNPVTNEINWQAHDPVTLVENLTGMKVYLYTGNGLPGPFDKSSAAATTSGARLPPAAAIPYPPGIAPAMAVEALAHLQTTALNRHATQLGLDLHLLDYGAGTHSFAYWTRDLRWFLPHMMRAFASAPNRPAAITYLSADKSWRQWGWSASFTRSAQREFSQLKQASRHGFVLYGTGSAVVTTPSFYRPGSAVKVTVTKGGADTTQRLQVDHDGRLHVPVVVGGAPLTPAGLATIGAPSYPTSRVTVRVRPL
jgi:S-formylglutathione hydrolase FrmB